MNDNDDWGTPPPIQTNLTGDLQRAFNYGWKSAMEHVNANKHLELTDSTIGTVERRDEWKEPKCIGYYDAKTESIVALEPTQNTGDGNGN